ncbi:MAG TPA: JAB domain-containing protein [Candidatus Obscuribacterales bacterium]
MTSKALKKHLEYKLPQIRLAIIRDRVCEPIPIMTPYDLEQFVEPLKHFSEEYFIAYHLDARHHVVAYHEVSHGTVSSSLVHPREVFKAAILSNTHSIIVAHNHPAGSLTPSTEDIGVTEQLVKVGKLMGIPILDHLIVSQNGIQSMRELNKYLFE